MNEQELGVICEKLRARGSYFADPDLPGHLQWLKFQECDVVVAQEAVQEYEKANAAYRQRQLKEPPSPPPAAIFSGIVRLSDQRYFMTACSDWNPEVAARRDGPKKLANVRPSAIAEDPGIKSLSGDFEAGWKNLNSLVKSFFPADEWWRFQESIGTVDWLAGKGYHGKGFQVRHRIFKKRETNEQDEEEEDDPRFLIRNWPVWHPEARKELARLKDTHVVEPIPAYDFAGNLIPPTEYERMLRGAIVRLHFRLVHWHINGRHIFNAVVAQMRVLVPPPPRFTKRKLMAKVDDFDGESYSVPASPVKKRKVSVKREDSLYVGNALKPSAR